ncbi:MAG TPA: type II toxin-antitoxin system prevent-host-death family antitoxin [Thermoanaerobaculia bacterium]
MSELLSQVRETRQPLVLTENGEEAAVLLDFAAYQDLLEEIELLQDALRGLVDVQEGRVVSHEEARARLLARFS